LLVRTKEVMLNNTRNLKHIFILVAFAFFSVSTMAQSGPGGVGNGAGATGQPRNVIWLRADAGVTQSGTVDAWADQSGNGLIATGIGATRPSFVTSDANFNNLPVINFAATGTNKHVVVADNDILDNTNGFSLFIVFRTSLTASNYALLSKRTSAGVDQSYMTWVNAGQLSSRASANQINGGTLNTTTTYIGSTVYDGGASTVSSFVNGASAASGAAPTSIPNNASDLFIGAFDVSVGETRNLDGRIAEALVYTSTLNAAQRQIVENYLAAKYNLTITGDVYVGDGSGFDFDVAGIGRSSGASHTEASSTGLVLSTYNGSLDTNGEFLIAGRATGANAVVNCACAGFPGAIQQRWGRTWFIDKTTAGSLDAAISFDFGDGIAGQFPQNKNDYELLYSSDGGTTYSIVSIPPADKSISGDRMVFRVPNASLLDGIYTLGTTNSTQSPVNGLANKTWYSYQSGNANNPLVWTLDSGVTPLYVNPSNETPGAADNVVITSGKTITLVADNFSVNNLEVFGTLDLGQFSGHSTTAISGTGRIRLAGSASNVDNFPTGVTTAFANATTGGTVEIYGTSTFSLNQTRLYNDLIINKTGGVVSLNANYTLNGEFTINSGEFRFGTTASNFIVNGDIQVNTGTAISVANANVRHQFDVYSNFTNNGGTVQFTNRASANHTVEATDGIVDFNLLNGTRNQTVTCNGVTRFYRIEIDKGTDDTYDAIFTANSTGNFSLFGYANDNDGAVAQLTSSNNAFALLRGTAEIRANITVPTLSINGNYNISVGAQLWVNGGTVLNNSGNSTVPYGKIRVSGGLFESRVNAGITTRDNGTIIVEGGVVNTNQIRTSVLGASNVGGYVQSGGNVTVDGGGPGGSGLDYYVFSLTYPGNVFQMSGGTLTVRGARAGTAGTRGGIFINSDPANVSVTGGTIVAEISNANPYVITARVPFWNLILRNTFDATLRDVDLLGGTSGPAGGGASEITLAAQNLIVKGGLTIENNVRLDHNGRNLNIAGNLTIQATGDLIYDPVLANGRRNTVTLDGSDNATLTFLNRTGGGNDEQDFWNLIINKPADKVVTLASGKTNLNGTNNNLVNVQGDAFKLFSGTLDQGFHSVRLFCDTIVNYQTVGVYSGATTALGSVSNDANDMIRFRNNPTPTILLTTPNAVFGAVRFNRTGAPIKLNSNLRIQLLEYLFGKWDIGTYRLTIDRLVGENDNFATLPPGDNNADSLGLQNRRFSVEDMIASSGNNSDGGLSIYIPAGTPNGTRFVFPIGIGVSANDAANTAGTDKYTPAYVTVSNVTDDGYITINPVNTALDLLNGFPNNMMQYYWNVKHTGFTSVPNVRLQFTYNDADDNNGTVTNYVPGRVVGFSTREADTGGTAAVRESLRQIDFTTGVLTTGLYTAAEPAAFTGTIQVFFNRESANNWNDVNKWSTVGFNGAVAAEFPGPGDVVRFRNQDGSASGNSWVDMNINTSVAAIIFDNTGGGWRNRLSINAGQTVSLGIIEGEGEIFIRANGGTMANVTDSDFGNFASQTNSFFIYNAQDNNTYSMLSNIATYPNLRIEGSDGTNNNGLRVLRNTTPITVNQDVWIDWGGTLRAEAAINIVRNLLPGQGGGGGGRFQFGENGSHTVTVGNNLSMTANANNRVEVLNTTPNSRIHRFKIGASVTQNNGIIDLFNGTGTANNAILELNTTTAGTLAVIAGSTPDLFRIAMNKGTSAGSTFTISDPVTLNGPFDGLTPSSKPLELLNGLLIMNDPLLTFTLSTGGSSFSIPGTAGLEVANGTATVTGSDIGVLCDGLLRVSGGTVSIDDAVGNGNNFIEYSASGNAVIEVSSGSLTVGSQIRRSLTSTAGILKYRQTGGAVTVGRRTAPNNTRGVFEVVNNGSEFVHSGGATLTIVRGISSATVPSVLITPETPVSLTSTSNIVIGTVNTPTGSNGQNIGISSNSGLGNLTINNSSGNAPRALIYSLPLSINGTFSINSGTTFNAQSLGLDLKGNMVIDGNFIPSGNTTTFSATGAQAVSGSGAKNFFNLTKTNSGTLGLSTSINVTNDLRVEQGVVADNGNSINLQGNAYFGLAPATSGTHTSTAGGNGLVFMGSGQQQLFALRTDGLADLGTVTIDNLAGVVIPDNSDKFTINTRLRLSKGVLDIGGSLLTLGINCDIEQVNTFSVSNMIQTNSSFTDNGVKKIFPALSTTPFIFPVGQALYTPASFDFADLGPGSGTGTTSPSITVRPANERQPIIQEDVEAGLCTVQIDDQNNVLQYHWIITAEGATNFESNVVLQYQQSLVALANGLTEADYIAARIRTSDATVFKFPDATAVDETNNRINFSFNNVSTAEISAEYLAGVDCAIPNNIITYVTKGGGAGTGNVTSSSIYVGDPSPLTLSGSIIRVAAGDVVTIPSTTDNIILYRTEINGTLDIKSGSIGHRLGTVAGTGTLSFEVIAPDLSAVFPAGFYTDFLSCSGGGLQFAGNTNYEVLGGISSLRRLTLTGTGNRTLGNNDITICEDLTVNGPSFLNTNNRNITIQRDALINSGSFSTGSGTILINRDLRVAGGTFNGQTSGNKTIGNDLVVSSGSFTAGSGGNLTLRRNLVYSGGTFSGGTSTHRTIFQGAVAQNTSGNLSLNQLEINNGLGLTLGGNVTVDNQLILTNGNITPGTTTFLIGSSATSAPAEGRANSFVNGKLFKALGAGGAPTSANTFTFPIGSGSRWRSGSISVSSGTAATWDMEYIIGNADALEASVTNMTPVFPIVRIATGEYWRVSDGSVSATGRTALIGLSWGIESDVSANTVERQDLRVLQWVSPQWQNRGGANFSSGNTQSRGTFEAQSTISFSQQIVTLGSVDTSNPLPVTLVRFEGQLNGSIALLNWTTSSEINNDYFEIQRSTDGAEFISIGKVTGKGTTNLTSNYWFEDKRLARGNNYYRLKQVDYDGKSSFSNVILIDYDGSTPLGISLFPNPTTWQDINLELVNSTGEDAVVRIHDLSGKTIFQRIVTAENLNTSMVLKTDELSAGVYIVELVQGTQRVVKRLLVKE
jgi:hypothetical protein